MSVGWIGESAVVDESRNGCIAWIAVRLRRLAMFGAVILVVAGIADVDVLAAEEVESAFARSCTFIEAAEPGMRLTSAGALRNSDRVEAATSAPSAGTAPDTGLATATIVFVVCYR